MRSFITSPFAAYTDSGRCRLGEITESSLTKQLRELEADGFLIRRDFKEIPPHVEYTLSDLGSSFMDVISYMKAWGDRNLPREP